MQPDEVRSYEACSYRNLVPLRITRVTIFVFNHRGHLRSTQRALRDQITERAELNTYPVAREPQRVFAVAHERVMNALRRRWIEPTGHEGSFRKREWLAVQTKGIGPGHDGRRIDVDGFRG